MAKSENPEEQAAWWVGAVLGKQQPEGMSLQEWLKSGVALCELMNVISPGSTATPSSSDELERAPHLIRRLKEIENIAAYSEASRIFGVPGPDGFESFDLYDNKNFPAVVRNLHSLGRVAQQRGFAGPTLGARLASRNVRTFSQAQLDEARAMPAKWTYRGETRESVLPKKAPPPQPAPQPKAGALDPGPDQEHNQHHGSELAAMLNEQEEEKAGEEATPSDYVLATRSAEEEISQETSQEISQKVSRTSSEEANGLAVGLLMRKSSFSMRRLSLKKRREAAAASPPGASGGEQAKGDDQGVAAQQAQEPKRGGIRDLVRKLSFSKPKQKPMLRPPGPAPEPDSDPEPAVASTPEPPPSPPQSSAWETKVWCSPFDGAPPAGEMSQVDTLLDSMGLGLIKEDLRAAQVYRIIDLANMDPSEICAALPKVDAKVRNKLISKLEEVEIPD